jgi:hypothetical protein
MTDLIYKVWLPQAIVMKVPYELFGKLNPKKLEPFRDALQITQDEARASLWLQGLYFKIAVVSALNKDVEYPDKPIDLTAKKENSGLNLDNKALMFSAWADVFNEGFMQRNKETNNQEGQ